MYDFILTRTTLENLKYRSVSNGFTNSIEGGVVFFLRMDIKTVKGKDYLQIVDNRGYIHHVGPSTLLNLAVCQRILGLDDSFRLQRERLEMLENYIASKGYPMWEKNQEGTAKTLAREIVAHYGDARSGMGARSNSCGESIEIENSENKWLDRIDIFEMLEEQVRKHFESKNVVLSKNDLRKITQSTYRHASVEERVEWMKELEQRRQREIDMLFNSKRKNQ